VALAVGAHLAGHGRAPAGWAVGAAVAGVALVSGPFTGRQRSGTTIGTVMIAVQAGLHVWFSLSAPVVPVTGPGVAMPGMDVPGMDVAGMTMGPWMVTAHLVAALGASWLLWRCDEVMGTAAMLTEALFAALFDAARVLPAPLGRPVARDRWFRVTRPGAGSPVRAALLVGSCVVRRGPPAGTRLATTAGLAMTVTA
jgi:hypothetical protein